MNAVVTASLPLATQFITGGGYSSYQPHQI
jgi:hypothetical protein